MQYEYHPTKKRQTTQINYGFAGARLWGLPVLTFHIRTVSSPEPEPETTRVPSWEKVTESNTLPECLSSGSHTYSLSLLQVPDTHGLIKRT